MNGSSYKSIIEIGWLQAQPRIALSLHDWATKIIAEGIVQNVYAFGSIVNESGSYFDPRLPVMSDVDLLAVFREECILPVNRVITCQRLLASTQQMETKIKSALKVSSRPRSILSLGAVSQSEFEWGINIGRDAEFARNRFVQLTDSKIVSGNRTPSCLLDKYSDLYRVLAQSQDYRKNFLSTDKPRNVRSVRPGDEPLKSLARSAAILKSVVNPPGGNSVMEERCSLYHGCQYLKALLQSHPNEACERLFRKMEIGSIRPMEYTPVDQLLGWELLSYEALAFAKRSVPDRERNPHLSAFKILSLESPAA